MANPTTLSKRGATNVSPDIFEVVEGFATEIDGAPTVIPLGTRVRAGHPIMAGRESFFAPLEIHYEYETATAEPGEKRGAKSA